MAALGRQPPATAPGQKTNFNALPRPANYVPGLGRGATGARTPCCYYQGEGTLDKYTGLMHGRGAQASPPGPILGLLGRRRRCQPASGCVSFCVQLHTNARGSSPQRCAFLLQGVAPAKAAANDAAAAAKKKAADEEAAGEDDSKFDEFMVGRSASCSLWVPAPNTTRLCVSQQYLVCRATMRARLPAPRASTTRTTRRLMRCALRLGAQLQPVWHPGLAGASAAVLKWCAGMGGD